MNVFTKGQLVKCNERIDFGSGFWSFPKGMQFIVDTVVGDTYLCRAGFIQHTFNGSQLELCDKN